MPALSIELALSGNRATLFKRNPPMVGRRSFQIKQGFFNKRHITVPVDKIHDKNLIQVCEQIDTFFCSTEPEVLKDDHSSTVIKTFSKDSVFVIKRDNPGNILKYIKRIFKKSRSFRVWSKAAFLQSKSLDTLCPLALVEDYAGIVRLQSFVVSEFINGPTLEDFLCDSSSSVEKIKTISQKAMMALEKWHQNGVSHRDPKAKNIILKDGRLFFIDTEDVSVPRLKMMKRNDFSRDIAIMLYNFRNHKAMKDALLKNICKTYELGLYFLAERLIEKFWKTELFMLLQSLKKNEKSLTAKDESQIIRGSSEWKKVNKKGAHEIFLSSKDPAETMVTFSPFWRKQKLKNYYKKIRVPSCGILSMTLCLRICGFILPEITGCGIVNGTEYIVYSPPHHTLSFKNFWLLKNEDPVAGSNLMNSLGEELGRFHAMGFRNSCLSLDNIYINKKKGEYGVEFPLTPSTNRHRVPYCFGGKRLTEKLENEIAALSSNGHSDIFLKAHERIMQKKSI